jgi:hypothetical protein
MIMFFTYPLYFKFPGKNLDFINQYIYGHNLVHMKTYEQRGHDSNKGDIFAYDGIYRLTGMKFNSPEPANPAADQFEKHKAVTFDQLSNILNIVENQDGQDKNHNHKYPGWFELFKAESG